MAEPTQDEIMLSIRRAYLLGKAFNAEAIWLRNYLKPQHVKNLNEAKAKVNHFTREATSMMSKEAIDIVEERAYEMLEEFFEGIKNESSTSRK